MTAEAFAEHSDLPLIERAGVRMAVRPCSFYVLNLERQNVSSTTDGGKLNRKHV